MWTCKSSIVRSCQEKVQHFSIKSKPRWRSLSVRLAEKTCGDVVKIKRNKRLGHFSVRDWLPTVVSNWMTNWGWSKICLSVCVSVLKCSKQSIRRNRLMTGPFMIVGTEDSIHDWAMVMRRRADVSAYEYDIVLSVPRIWETSLYWL